MYFIRCCVAEEQEPQKIPLIFFRTAGGSEPVREWLKTLGEVERQAIGRDLMRAQWRWPVGMPLCRPMGKGLWEIRTDLTDNRAVLYLPGPHGSATRVHKENTSDTGSRFEIGAQASEGAGAMSKRNMGSSIDDFLKEEGIFEEAQAQAVKEVVAWQLAEAMKKKKISKARMAVMLKTSRTQVDRILDPRNDITLSSLQRAAALVGRRVMIELV
jgi:antitoxin HicB